MDGSDQGGKPEMARVLVTFKGWAASQTVEGREQEGQPLGFSRSCLWEGWEEQFGERVGWAVLWSTAGSGYFCLVD